MENGRIKEKKNRQKFEHNLPGPTCRQAHQGNSNEGVYETVGDKATMKINDSQ